MAHLRLSGQVTGEGSTTRKAVQAFKGTQARARIGGNVGHTHLLPGACALHALGHVVGQAQLTRRQEQQAPGQAGTGCAVTGSAGLALLIGQHVGALPRHLALYLRQLVQNQERIAVLRGDGL